MFIDNEDQITFTDISCGTIPFPPLGQLWQVLAFPEMLYHDLRMSPSLTTRKIFVGRDI